MIVVVLESEETLISNAIHKCFETDMRIDIIPIPDNSAMGTADSLRHIKDKIKVKIIFYRLIKCTLTMQYSFDRLYLSKLSKLEANQTCKKSFIFRSNCKQNVYYKICNASNPVSNFF